MDPGHDPEDVALTSLVGCLFHNDRRTRAGVLHLAEPEEYLKLALLAD